MNVEFEAMFLGVDIPQFRIKLSEAGAQCTMKERLMKRSNYFLPNMPDSQDTWLRVRDEGDRVTMTIKQNSEQATIDSQKELEMIVSDYDTAVAVILKMGAVQKSYQETRRETWEFRGVEIALDTWPGLRSYVEIEGCNEDIVQEVSTLLGFSYTDALFDDVGKVYELELGIPQKEMYDVPVITFENPPQKR